MAADDGSSLDMENETGSSASPPGAPAGAVDACGEYGAGLTRPQTPGPWRVVGDYERGGLGIETADDSVIGSAIVYARGSWIPPRRRDAEAIGDLPQVWDALDAANAHIARLTVRAQEAETKMARLRLVAEAALGPVLAARLMEEG